MDAITYAKRFSVTCNLGLRQNLHLCEAFMLHANDQEMDTHFRMAFPQFSTSGAIERLSDDFYLSAANMYARILPNLLPLEEAICLAETSPASSDLRLQLRELGAREFASFLDLAKT